MTQCSNTGNGGLLLLAALVAIEIAGSVSEEQLELLAAFFTILGDALVLLALPSALGSCASGTGTTPASGG